MANKKTLKGYFETGDIPNQSQYHELINSNLNLNETGTQSITGSLIVSQSVLLESDLTASGNISASGDMYANKYHSNGYNLLRYHILQDRTIVGSKFKTTQITGSSLILGDTPGFHVTASGNISSSGTIIANNFTGIFNGALSSSAQIAANISGALSLTAIASLGGYIISSSAQGHITASGNISASGDIYANAYYGDGSGLTNAPSTYTNITASGNISASGTVIASDYTLDGVALTTTFTELNYLDGLTSGEATQIKAIGTNVISATEWSYVAGNNQLVASTSAPTFAGLTLAKVDYETLDLDSTTTHSLDGSTAGQLSVRAVPSILAGASSPSYVLTGNIINSTSVIMISTSALITCNATNITDDGCKITFHNPTQTDYTGGDVTINIVII